MKNKLNKKNSQKRIKPSIFQNYYGNNNSSATYNSPIKNVEHSRMEIF
jgi:hypothetical protein